MKRYLKTITAVVLAALTTAACQKENFGDATPAGQEVDVTLDLLAPQIGTKSYGDGTTAKTVYVHVYQQDATGGLTYIQPAAEGASLKTPSQSLTLNGRKATYSTRLVTGQTYTFVFWAQADNAPYKYNTEAKTITVDYASAAGNDESRDAFYNVLPNVKIEGAYTASVQLSRPFAQLNFGAADYKEAKAAGLTVTDATVELTHAATSLNLIDGTTAGDETVTFASAALPADPNAILTAGGKNYKYVAMDYVLVGKAAKTLSDVTLTLTATGTQSTTPEFTYSNVPLQANYRTNIVGNLFTSPAEVNITVNPAFDTPDYDVVVGAANLAAANEAFAKGATAVTVEEIVSSDPDVIVLPKTSEGVTITLPQAPAGKSITIKYDDTAAAGQKPQTLKVTAKNAASITIVAPDTHVEVNGVTVGTLTATTSGSTLVVGKDVKITTLNIEQGAAEIYGNVSNVLKGENAGAIFCYVKDKKDAPANVDAVCVKTAEGLTAYVYNQIAFEPALNRADKVVLEANMELNADVVVSHDTELDLNKHVVSNVVDIWVDDVVVSLITVDNCTFSVVGTNSGKVIAKKDDCYTFNVKGNGKLIIDGGTYVGNISVIQVQEGTVEVKDGKFSLDQKWPKVGNGSEYLINLIDKAGKDGSASAIVSGGDFIDFDPGNNLAEGKGTNFCAEGYASTRTILSMSSDVKEYTVKKVTEVSDASSLIDAAEDNEPYIRLMSNIEVDRTVIVGSNWSYVTLDLNGHKITNSKSIWNADKGDWSILSLRSISGCLIVKGNGIIEAKEESNDSKDAYAIDVQNKSAKVFLVDGEFVGRTHSVYSFAGDVYIEGGKYSNTNEENHDYVINCYNDNYKNKAANIIVKGGEFANFNPGDCRAEGEHTSFLASGYKSEKDGDCYKVVKAE